MNNFKSVLILGGRQWSKTEGGLQNNFVLNLLLFVGRLSEHQDLGFAVHQDYSPNAYRTKRVHRNGRTVSFVRGFLVSIHPYIPLSVEMSYRFICRALELVTFGRLKLQDPKGDF